VIVPVLFVVGSIVGFVVVGIPYERDTLAAWLLLGLFCFSLSDLRGYARGLIRDWLPFFAILIAYDSLRGSAGKLFPVHYLPQIDADRALFGGSVPTVTLQRWLWHGHVVWYDVVAWMVYMTHFFATPVLAAVLWKLNRQRFRRFSVAVIVLSFAGLVTYTFYPAAPPWLASRHHLIAPITRIIPAVWTALPVHGVGTVVEGGYRFANNVAAVPSLHAAFSLLVAVTLWPKERFKWLRPLVALYPVAMALSVVYTGEHYVSDVLLGWLYTAVVMIAVKTSVARYEAWREGRRVASSLSPAPIGQPLPYPAPSADTAG